MIRIDCRLGVVNEALHLPPFFQDRAELQGRIGEVFRIASGSDIDLRMDAAQMVPVPLPRDQAVTALDLHVALSDLIGNPARRPVARIGLLLAHAYAPIRGALGIMFDRGAPTIDDPTAAPQFTSVPREGCAVFTGSIAALRSDPRDEVKEAQFTATHELGHLFNLQHTLTSLTFMTPSRKDRVFNPAEVNFDPFQCNWLAKCSRSLAVAPGGNPFGVDGIGQVPDPLGHLSVPSARAAEPFGLELRIGMRRHEFWRFEPTQLDVRLATLPGVRRKFRVPQMMDPGYPRFAIYIEDPLGVRRRFRSSVAYCDAHQQLIVGPDAPFERDIQIFQERGTYTFRQPGRHRIYAVFAVSARHVLNSNVLEVNVLNEPNRSVKHEALSAALSRAASRTVLVHQQDTREGRGLKLLSKSIAMNAHAEIDADLRYSFGRASLARAAGSRGCWPPRVQQRGRVELARALDSGHLSRHRKEIAERCLSSSRD